MVLKRLLARLESAMRAAAKEEKTNERLLPDQKPDRKADLHHRPGGLRLFGRGGNHGQTAELPEIFYISQ